MRKNEFDYAVEMLKKEYERGQNLAYVKSPIAWALYKTWRFFDSQRRRSDADDIGGK